MSIYAISDLHLSFSNDDKTMELFGDEWKNHAQKIEENWRDTVKENDTVLIAGDISWGKNLEEAKEDFRFIDSLPGNKIIIKGNHDYYFVTKKKVDKFLEENNFNTISILFNNSFIVEGYAICGTRGWGNIIEDDVNVDNEKIIAREIGRLKLSYNSLSDEDKKKDIIVVTHFPPFLYEFKNVLKEIAPKKCIYGHLHGNGHYMVKQGNIDGIDFVMVAVDYTNFKLVKIA